jgi:acyl carrier protein
MLSGGLPPQIGVFPVNWSRFGAQFHRGVPPLLANLVEAAPVRAAVSNRCRWATVPPAEQGSALQTFLRSELAAVLGISDVARVPIRQGFFEIGMDSLMTVELVNRLESSLGLRLPASLAIDYPNVESLAGFIASQLFAVPKPVAIPSGAGDLEGLPTAELARLLASELGTD